MADEQTQTPLDNIIGEGRDAGPGAKPEADQQPQQPSPSEQAGVTPPPSETEEKPGLWAYSALQDERAKRAAFQQQARALQEERDALLAAQERALQQPQGQQPQPLAGESDAEAEFWANPSEFIHKRLKNQEANFSFRLAHEKYGDHFEHAYSTMLAMAQNGDPSVVRWCMASPDPGMAMMYWYQQASQQQQRPGGPVMPSKLTGARNVGSRRGPAWSGPTPLESIFDMRNKG